MDANKQIIQDSAYESGFQDGYEAGYRMAKMDREKIVPPEKFDTGMRAWESYFRCTKCNYMVSATARYCQHCGVHLRKGTW